jgi:hypothetical protein
LCISTEKKEAGMLASEILSAPKSIGAEKILAEHLREGKNLKANRKKSNK